MVPVHFVPLQRKEEGVDPSTPWSWIRFLVDDIILGGFALLCSIVLHLVKGGLWQYRQSTNNISLEQRTPLWVST